MTIIIFQKLFPAMFLGMTEPLGYSQKSGPWNLASETNNMHQS